MSEYSEALREAMQMLAAQPRAVFIGQSVGDGGTKICDALEGIPAYQRIEFPVIEQTQLGVAIGMSLDGMLPICVYPRINFFLEATGMLVSHLDKIFTYSRGSFKPKVIIRTAVGHSEPLNPGVQHLGDYHDAYCHMLDVVSVRRMTSADAVRRAYREALEYEHSSLMIEMAECY